MTFKSILFCLFLYVALVWVSAYYFFTGDRVQQVGLLWTGAGLLTVLLLSLISRLVGWWRLLRARAIVKPVAKPKPVERAEPVYEDEAALATLLQEANAVLGRTKAYANSQPAVTMANFPVYLLVGPEGAGKGSAFLDAGLDPQLLAGNAGRPGAAGPTRVANIWLAKERIFIELGGRSFNGDLGRWQRLLRVLEGKPEATGWQKYWKEAASGLDLRGVIGCCDVKEFTAAVSPQGRERLENQIRHWQERLGAVAEVFGIECPVQMVITQCDAIPYFADYFRRLPESEAGQVLGNAVTGQAAGAEAESKLLTKSFNALYYSLSEKRIDRLAHEPDAARRPAVYEFPRELKRIRGPLVQFLTAVFRPSPLRPGPKLRGYYFSGTIEREMTAASLLETRANWRQASSNLEATSLFRNEATQIMRGGGDGGNYAKHTGSLSTRAAPMIQRWLFVRELFESVIPADAGPRRAVRTKSRVELYRKAAALATCGMCLPLCLAFATSWLGNWRLLHSLRNETVTTKRNGAPTLTELESLDDLRAQVSELRHYDQDGPPLHLRWGLYSGSGMLAPMQATYFRRFQELLLNRLNAAIARKLQTLPTTPGANDSYAPVFRLLKTQVMITSGACQPEPEFVAGVLKEVRTEVMGGQEANWPVLADRQIDFYANQLRSANPCRLAENKAARERARTYLANIQGPERIYAGLLASTRRSFPNGLRLGDLAPDYRKVLNGPAEVEGIFSREGWNSFQNSAGSGKTSGGEACVLGEHGSSSGEGRRDSETQQALQRMFLHDYAERWRTYVSSFAVSHYGGAGDAARKLEILSGHKSPLLALMALVSSQTTFRQSAAEPQVIDRVTPIVQKWLPKLGRGAQAANKINAEKEAAPREGMSTTGDMTRAFQPVHWVVPAGSETWVTEKNGAYVDALAALGQSMEAISRAASTPDPGLNQAASQSYDKALDAARQLSRGFEPVGVEGLDTTVQRLLEAPIRLAAPYIINDLPRAKAEKVNGQLRQLCQRAASTLHRYPFAVSDADTTLEEVAGLFALNTGAIWKFEAESLADSLVKDNARWQVKDPAAKPQITPDMINFLNRSQAIADAFYPAGNTQPQFTYTLRPRLDASFKDVVLELEVDGQMHAWTSSLQKQFTWPPAAGAKDIGVRGRIRTGALDVPFVSRGGIWAIFRVMGDAEPRPLGSRTVEWKFLRGGGGRLEPIQPAPVRLEFVEFPGGVDMFNPNFLQGLACPAYAMQ